MSLSIKPAIVCIYYMYNKHIAHQNEAKEQEKQGALFVDYIYIYMAVCMCESIGIVVWRQENILSLIP